MLDGLLVDAERLLQYHVAHGRVGPEQHVPHLLYPGFWQLSPDRATAASLPTFSWKWMTALGNTNTSPAFNVVANS
jgi:hypothetical protein